MKNYRIVYLNWEIVIWIIYEYSKEAYIFVYRSNYFFIPRGIVPAQIYSTSIYLFLFIT